MNTRRSFLRGAGVSVGAALVVGAAPKTPAAAPAPASPLPLVKPRALKPGDTVGLISPSSYIFDLWKMDSAVTRLESLGLKSKIGRHAKARHGYMAGTVQERVDDLHAMFSDPTVAAVFCLGGGYGTERLLDSIDYALIRKNPKILLGYSDITGLHLAINRRAGVVTFHGPVALSSLPAFTLESLKKALFVSEPIGELGNPPEKDPLSPEFPRHTVAPGRARGPIIGGNLTLISTTMGTPYEIDTRGKILFIEDVGEAPYRIDRMLVQLKLAGKLDEAAGIVWGTCTDCTVSNSSFEVNLSISDLVDEILGGINKPVLAGLVFGHTKEKLTLPIGVMAEMDAAAKTVSIVEAATVAGVS
ncbi:MAG: LD-carboxypeptidase [Acidobacteria bacterium]|nr:LD-carboxypeptidase [Acidobacteriota bacterium]MCA1610339.1 LD-carboxypeptidase [Acidobacteriota bacterium]